MYRKLCLKGGLSDFKSVSSVLFKCGSTQESLTSTWNKRWEQCQAGGGEKATQRHVIKNKKLPVREKLQRILDPGTPMLEWGRQAGLDLRYGDVPCAGGLGVVGVVGGVLTLIMANDATVKGGTVFPITLKKQLRMQDIANKFNLPCLFVVDSGGAYLPEQANIFIEGGKSFYKQAVMAARGLPQISLVCGSCTAGAAYSSVMPSHCVIMKGIGSLYLAGPPLVKAATGEEVSAEELGGADLHCRVSGSTDYYVEGYDEAIQTVRNIVHLHSDVFPAPKGWSDRVEEKCSFTSDVAQIVVDIADEGTQLKFKEFFGVGIQCSFAKLGGLKVGILAGQGDIDGKGALKASNFVQICQQTGIPLIFIQGDIKTSYTRELASLMRSVATATVPKITLITGNTSGHAYLAMCGGGLLPDLSYQWPSARVTCDDTDDAHSLDAWECSSNMICDDVILPSETRETLRLSLLTAQAFRNSDLRTGSNSVLKF